MIALVGNGPSSWWLGAEWVYRMQRAGLRVFTMNARRLPGDGVFFHDKPPAQAWVQDPPDGRTVYTFRKHLSPGPYPEGWVELPQALEGACAGRVALWWALERGIERGEEGPIYLLGFDGDGDRRTIPESIEAGGGNTSANAHRNWCRKILQDHQQRLRDFPARVVLVLDHDKPHTLEGLPAERITSAEFRALLRWTPTTSEKEVEE